MRSPSADKAIGWALVRGGGRDIRPFSGLLVMLGKEEEGDFSSDVEEEMQGRLKEAGRKG